MCFFYDYLCVYVCVLINLDSKSWVLLRKIEQCPLEDIWGLLGLSEAFGGKPSL